MSLLEQVWQSRMLSNFGTFAKRLEALSSDYLEVQTRSVVSGDIGLVLTIAALDLPAGSSVVVPSFTFNSTINAVLWNRLRPVFADIDPRTFNLDPASADEAADQHDARLVLATHVFGNPADATGLAEVAARRDARLVFDAAQAYGSRRGDHRVGGFGDAEVFSLSGTKLVTSGEGGLIASRDDEILDKIRYLRGYGFLDDYNSQFVGMNGKISELHSALGLLTLARIEGAVAARQTLVEEYRQRLSGLPVTYQEIRAQDRSTYKDFAILFNSPEGRGRAEAALTSARIQTKRYFFPCHLQDAYLGAAMVDLPNTEDVYSRALCIPLFESLQPNEMDLIVSTMAEST